jgi:hypothetical protein
MIAGRTCVTIVYLMGCAAAAKLDGQEVEFHKQPARPGDVARQTLRCDVDLVMSICQGGQTVQEQRQTLQRQQKRQLTILQVAEKGPWQADIRYDSSTVSVQAADGEAETVEQGVSGKTYRITRKGEKLEVAYADGKLPPAPEIETVRENMNAFGLPNPIAEFFAGKRIRVGESLQLPPDVAQELLGFTETVGSASAFRLKLIETRPGQKGRAGVAVFDIELQADDPQQAGIEMRLSGKLEMEIQSCRARSIHLAGPVAAEETHGPTGGQFQVKSAGQIDVAVKADYLRR